MLVAIVRINAYKVNFNINLFTHGYNIDFRYLLQISFWIYDNSIAVTRNFGDVNEANINGLSRYFTYSFRINAFTEGGDGPFSTTVTKYTNLPVPGNAADTNVYIVRNKLILRISDLL